MILISYTDKRNICLCFSSGHIFFKLLSIGFVREESRIQPCCALINIALKSFVFSVIYTKPARDLLHFTHDLEFRFSNIMRLGFCNNIIVSTVLNSFFFPLYFIYILAAAFYKYKVALKTFNQSLNIYFFL